RYVGILSDAASLVVTEDDEGCRMILELFGGGQPVPRQRFEFDLLTVLSFCRWITNRDLRPLALELRFPPPADLQPYKDAFKCSLRFNSSANALLFARADVISPLPTARCMSGSPANISRGWTLPTSAVEPAPRSFATCRRANRGARKSPISWR